MSAVKAAAKILKARFQNLTVEETIDLAEQIVEAVATAPVTNAQRAFIEAIDSSKCGHGRLHIFCGACTKMAQ